MHEKDSDPYKQGDTHLDKLIKKEYLKKILAVRRTDNWNDLLILRQAKIIKEKSLCLWRICSKVNIVYCVTRAVQDC